jgi:hypothetical protein
MSNDIAISYNFIFQRIRYRINWRSDVYLNNLCLWNQRNIVDAGSSLVGPEVGSFREVGPEVGPEVTWAH